MYLCMAHQSQTPVLGTLTDPLAWRHIHLHTISFSHINYTNMVTCEFLKWEQHWRHLIKDREDLYSDIALKIMKL
jgi:hypothetical protein